MAEFEDEGLDTNWERVEQIRRLCKGEGLGRVRMHVPLELMGVSDPGALITLMIRLRYQMPWISSTNALFNALNFRFLTSEPAVEPNDNLSGRREAFAASHQISVRTVMRLEERGAVLMDHYIQRLTRHRTPEEADLEALALYLGLSDVVRQATKREILVDLVGSIRPMVSILDMSLSLAASNARESKTNDG